MVVVARGDQLIRKIHVEFPWVLVFGLENSKPKKECTTILQNFLGWTLYFSVISKVKVANLAKQSVPQTRFGSYFQKGKIFLFKKESTFLFRENHPLLEDKKFKLLLLCILLVLCASRNISFNDGNHISKFITEGFENLPSSFFLISKICNKVLSSARGCIFYYPFGKFHLDIPIKMADNSGTALLHKTDFDISKDRFCWDYQLPTGTGRP